MKKLVLMLMLFVAPAFAQTTINYDEQNATQICFGPVYRPSVTAGYADEYRPYSIAKLDSTKIVFAFHDYSPPFGGQGESFALYIMLVNRLGSTLTSNSHAIVGCGEDDCSLGSVGWSDIIAIDSTTFVVIYSQAGPTGGCICGGDRWGAARVGKIVSGSIVLGEPFYFNGLKCDVGWDHCPEEDDNCGDGGTCIQGIGGDRNRAIYLGNNKFVVTYRDFDVSPTAANNSAIVGTVDAANYAISFGPRADTLNNSGSANAEGTQPNYTETIKIDGNRFLHVWSRSTAGFPGRACIGTVTNDTIQYGLITNYQQSEEDFAFSPVAVNLDNNKFILYYNRQGDGRARIGTISGTGANAAISFSSESDFNTNLVPINGSSNTNSRYVLSSIYNGALRLQTWLVSGNDVSLKFLQGLAQTSYGKVLALDNIAFISIWKGSDGVPNMAVSKACPSGTPPPVNLTPRHLPHGYEAFIQ